MRKVDESDNSGKANVREVNEEDSSNSEDVGKWDQVREEKNK